MPRSLGIMMFMNMESLTKSQIVLLTLLVSFVTSIATGITTVALMDQAPPAITQTINRVVEHTVERVVPAQTQPAAAATFIKETIIVKQSDAIASAVSSASPSIVRISMGKDSSPIAVGIVVTGSSIVTDSAIAKEGSVYTATLLSGEVVALSGSPKVLGSLALFSVVESTTTPKLATIAIQRSMPQLGETSIALTGLRATRIANGIITSVIPADVSTTTESIITPGVFETSIDLVPLAAGSAFISTEGALTGIYTSVLNVVTPVSSISALLRAATEDATDVN